MSERNAKWYRIRYRTINNIKRTITRLRHPWPIYRKVGGVSAIITRSDGTVIDLGVISDNYVLTRGYSVGSDEKN